MTGVPEPDRRWLDGNMANMADQVFWNFKLYIQLGSLGWLVVKFCTHPAQLFIIPCAVLLTTMLALVLLWHEQKELVKR